MAQLIDASGVVVFEGEIVDGGSQVVTRTTPRVVTALELSTLDSTPIELVPTPGPGFVLIPLNVFWFYYAGATQNDVDGTLNIDWDGTTYQLVSVLAALFRVDNRISTGTASAEARKTLDTAEDKALVLTIDVPVVSGDGSGVIIMDYTTVPTTA